MSATTGDPRLGLPGPRAWKGAWGGNVSVWPEYLSDGYALLLDAACADRALAARLAAPGKRDHRPALASFERVFEQQCVWHDWPVALALVWTPDEVGAAARGRSRHGPTARLVDPAGVFAADVDAAAFALLSAALGRVDRLTGSVVAGNEGPVVGFWQDGLLVGALFGRVGAPRGPVPAAQVLAGAEPPWPVVPPAHQGTGVPHWVWPPNPARTGTVYEPQGPGIWDVPDAERARAPDPGDAAACDAWLGASLLAVGGAAAPAAVGRAWVLPTRAGLVRVERAPQSERDNVGPWALRVRLRFAERRRLALLIAGGDGALPPRQGRPRAILGGDVVPALDQAPNERVTSFCQRVEQELAPLVLAPADRPVDVDVDAAFPLAPVSPPRDGVLPPGDLPVYVAVPRHEPAAPGEPAKGARWQVLNRQRWARLGGVASRAMAEQLATRANRVARHG